MVLLGETFPNFTAETSMGTIQLHEWLDNSWGILFSHPYDFTPICTTELARVVEIYPEFQRLGVKVIALSCNSVESHMAWIEDIKSYAKKQVSEFPYPIIADESRTIATSLGMLDPSEVDDSGISLTARAVFIIDPFKKMRLSILYPVSTGRNFDEIIRVIESLQLTDKHRVATPVDWKVGGDVMVVPTVSDEEAKQKYGDKMKIINVPLHLEKNIYVLFHSLQIVHNLSNSMMKKYIFDKILIKITMKIISFIVTIFLYNFFHE